MPYSDGSPVILLKVAFDMAARPSESLWNLFSIRSLSLNRSVIDCTGDPIEFVERGGEEPAGLRIKYAPTIVICVKMYVDVTLRWADALMDVLLTTYLSTRNTTYRYCVGLT